MLRKLILIPSLLLVFIVNNNKAKAQCGAGYNQVTLNWDNLDYFVYTGNYVSGNPGYYLSGIGDVTTQNFSFGTQRLTIVNNYTAANIGGDVSTHTGDGGSYGVGDDIQFTGDGTITFTFENSVSNLKFSLYDIDRGQRVQFSATNGVTPVNITLSQVSGSILTFSNNGTATARADAASTTVANTNTDGTVNVDISGPVTQVTLTISNTGTCSGGGCGTGGSETGIFFISDITACSAGNFPNSYYAVSKPFTGMPGYILHAFDDAVYAVNPATGVTKLLFTDPSGNNINSMAYDPYNRVLYYVYSLTANPGSNKIIKKYDFNTETISTALADVTTIGIPVVSSGGSSATNYTRGTGVESGAGAFYNGSLYLGIETPNKNGSGSVQGTSGREAVIWRIDFDASNVPYRASQVYATPTDDGGGTGLHDWSDFTMYNGVLYDFDGSGSGTQTDIDQVNMMTGTVTNFNAPASYPVAAERFVPGQPTVDWNGNIYNLTATSPGGASITPYVSLYNTTTGRLGTRLNLTSTPAYTPAIPSLGDAAEGFRPLVDYGDAPASYDPVSGDPAVHELDSTLNLGPAAASASKEWVTRGQTALATSDNFDDGVGTVTILDPTVSTYVVSVSVYNHTGATANVRGWLDYNGNGVFDAGEASAVVTVSSSASVQSINLSWSGISTPLTSGSYTYLRIRVTSVALAASAATGYLSNGEVEDYRVVVDHIVLGVKLLDFNATAKSKDLVSLTWTSTKEENFNGYQIEKSSDGSEWKAIGFIAGSIDNNDTHNYHFNDLQPVKGRTYYRLKLMNLNGTYEFSNVSNVIINDLINTINIMPNPAKDQVSIAVNSNIKSEGSIRFINVSGESVLSRFVKLDVGNNTIPVNGIDLLPRGTYIVQLVTGGQLFVRKLIISK